VNLVASERSDRMPIRSIRIISSGSIEGRPIVGGNGDAMAGASRFNNAKTTNGTRASKLWAMLDQSVSRNSWLRFIVHGSSVFVEGERNRRQMRSDFRGERRERSNAGRQKDADGNVSHHVMTDSIN
jgi:hypothetical protein